MCATSTKVSKYKLKLIEKPWISPDLQKSISIKSTWTDVKSIKLSKKSASSSPNVLNFCKEVISDLSFSSEIYPTLLKT